MRTFFSVSSLCRWWQSNAAFDKSTLSQIWSKTCTLYNAFKYHSVQSIKLHCTRINHYDIHNQSQSWMLLLAVRLCSNNAWLWHPLSVTKVHAHWNLDLFSTFVFFPTFFYSWHHWCIYTLITNSSSTSRPIKMQGTLHQFETFSSFPFATNLAAFITAMHTDIGASTVTT